MVKDFKKHIFGILNTSPNMAQKGFLGTFFDIRSQSEQGVWKIVTLQHFYKVNLQIKKPANNKSCLYLNCVWSKVFIFYKIVFLHPKSILPNFVFFLSLFSFLSLIVCNIIKHWLYYKTAKLNIKKMKKIFILRRKSLVGLTPGHFARIETSPSWSNKEIKFDSKPMTNDRQASWPRSVQYHLTKKLDTQKARKFDFDDRKSSIPRRSESLILMIEKFWYFVAYFTSRLMLTLMTYSVDCNILKLSTILLLNLSGIICETTLCAKDVGEIGTWLK